MRKRVAHLVKIPGSEPGRAASLAQVESLSTQATNELVASAAGDLFSPMNDIVKMVELMLETALTERQRHTLESVRASACDAQRMTNDLLDFSSLEAGKLVLEPTNFFLRAAVGETLRALALRAHRKGLELVWNAEPDVPDALIGDVGRLRQILSILVDSAISLTERGGVSVDIAVAPGEERRLRFSVRDTGTGIPRRLQAAASPQQTAGVGLGPRIASRLVALMGGEVAVDNEVGGGSIFTFTARFDHQAQVDETVATAAGDLRVLVVGEDGDHRSVLDAWLREANLDSTTVSDGVAAMDRLWEGVTTGRPYALALVEAHARRTDGPALVARIRARRELSATRIILVTSADRTAELARYRDLRIDADLAKPVGQHTLLETIRSTMTRTDIDDCRD